MKMTQLCWRALPSHSPIQVVAHSQTVPSTVPDLNCKPQWCPKAFLLVSPGLIPDRHSPFLARLVPRKGQLQRNPAGAS